MAQKNAPQPARAPQNRQAITLEVVARLAPNATQADKISTAFALFAAATGALHSYQELTGEKWKPYKALIASSRNVSAQAAAAQLDALG